MTIPEIKQQLKSFLPAASALRTASAIARSIREQASSLGALRYDTPKQQGGGAADPVYTAIRRMQDASERVAAAAKHYSEILGRVEQLIMLADDIDGQEILRLRYEQGIRFDYIPARINMDRSSMFRHYNRALYEISVKTEAETKRD